ncbi:MAG: S8 family serine peptidase [Ignavibacteria bacterium]|jgi:subtilisin family serine protease|nr:S8 family serine peptidase [Ignavibacteria bacterium]MCU7519607.1 S8 family serine peptidase [Ignavibacteria bacterium]MCU7525648.1 S8 family serine peptidase [Ignavibacteria bacterium]
MRFVFLLFITSVLFITGISQAQEAIPYSGNSASQSFIQEKPGHITGALIINDSVKVIDTDMTEMVNIIVEYKDTPLFMLQIDSKIKKPVTASYMSRQTQFSSDLPGLYEKANKAYNVQLGLPQKKREYFKLFSGASLSVPRAMISMISSLPYVRKVYMDKILKVNLRESVRLIGADSVWSKFNDEGDSIVIGIIDTGVDYLHPALGGGFGKGFKVMGGYDFVNRDNNPMDDHGHGTHVAGIAAADGTEIKGVAPKALLMAYKVLNKDGEGFESDCIAAVERTVDPNEDNNTEDMLDVVNMSLGAEEGNPFDPMSQAVNNAVRLGVTFCISAGNSGRDYRISSPGSSELAITVGATDKSTRLAYFSSKGPSKRLFAIKPEILAPGVGIRSCFLNGDYKTLDGTSMASPMVAGVCALLKHMHRNWTPKMIKSAIMATAKDYNLCPMSYGAGFLNAPKAMDVKSFAFPSGLSFGIDSMNSRAWIRKDTISILNESTSTQSYNITVDGLASGITLDVDRNVLLLQPGESGKVVFTLSVDNKTIEHMYMESYSYGGKVNIRGSADTLAIPWAFVRGPFVQVNFAKPPVFSFIYGTHDWRTLENEWTSNDLNQAEILLSKGSYSLISIFSDTENGIPALYFVDKPFSLGGFSSIYAGPSDAGNSIRVNGVDESGRKFSSLPNSRNNFFFSFPNYGVFSNARQGLYYSFSSDYILKVSNTTIFTAINAGQFQFDPAMDNAVRILRFPLMSNVTDSVNLTNSPSGFLKRTITINQPEGSEASISNCFNAPLNKIIIDDPSSRIKSPKWKGVLYMTPETDNSFAHSAIIQSLKENGVPNWTSGSLLARYGAVGVTPMGYYTPAPFITDPDEAISFGEGPVYADLYYGMALMGSSIQLCPHVSIYGRMNELRTGDESYTTYTSYDENGNIISYGPLSAMEFPQGRFKLEFTTSNFMVAGVKGKGRYYTEMSSAENKAELPHIVSLQILNSNGTPSGILTAGRRGKISFSVSSLDENFKNKIDTSWTRLYLKKNGSQEWEQVKIGKRTFSEDTTLTSTADIGKFLETDSTLIDLKIVTQSLSKQKVEWILVPAFAVGDYRYKISDEEDYTLRIPTADYILYNNFPNPFNASTVISYGLPKRSHVEVRIYDILGREVTTLVDRVQEAGQYKVAFDGRDLTSGMYICRMSSGSFAKVQKILLVK